MTNTNTCVCCGVEIPEGTHLCRICSTTLYGRIGGSRIRTGYCPTCNKIVTILCDSSIGYCPKCNHHLVMSPWRNEE